VTHWFEIYHQGQTRRWITYLLTDETNVTKTQKSFHDRLVIISQHHSPIVKHNHVMAKEDSNKSTTDDSRPCGSVCLSEEIIQIDHSMTTSNILHIDNPVTEIQLLYNNAPRTENNPAEYYNNFVPWFPDPPSLYIIGRRPSNEGITKDNGGIPTILVKKG
jgi:hypothetical protein